MEKRGGGAEDFYGIEVWCIMLLVTKLFSFEYYNMPNK